MNEIIPLDGGPIYVETDLTAFISEPWNAVSSIAILLPSIYWAIKLRGNIKIYSFLHFCIPLLFLGGLGSTLFHAFRASEWLLLMDILPTAILTLSVSIYLWVKVLPKWWIVIFIVLPFIAARFLVSNFIEPPTSINLNYFLIGSMIFIPLIIELIRTSYRGIDEIGVSIASMALALFFRERDFAMAEWLPMGSHFLWHLLSGIGAFYLAQYLYKLRRLEIQKI